MYCKGEGGAKNLTKAELYYDIAASQGSTRALNGHGYMYFYGLDGIEKNETKAFSYFLASAELLTDGDSCFNAGVCYENGLGR